MFNITVYTGTGDVPYISSSATVSCMHARVFAFELAEKAVTSIPTIRAITQRQQYSLHTSIPSKHDNELYTCSTRWTDQISTNHSHITLGSCHGSSDHGDNSIYVDCNTNLLNSSSLTIIIADCYYGLTICSNSHS